MHATFAQYLRLNVPTYATNRQVIKAAHRLLSPVGLSRRCRRARHLWLRSLLKLHHNAEAVAKRLGYR